MESLILKAQWLLRQESLRKSDRDHYPLIWALLIMCEEGALLCSVCQFSWCKYSQRGSVQPSSVISLDQSWEETQLVLRNLHGLAL